MSDQSLNEGFVMRIADPALQERRRNQILTAAETCFIEKGFHQTSVAEIAKASGVSMGLMYRYFKGKDEIILTFAARDRDLALMGIEEFAQADKPRNTLAKHLDLVLFEAFNKPTARMIIEVMAEAGRNELILVALKKDDHAICKGLGDAVKTQQRAGRIDKSLDSAMAARVLMTLFDGLVGRALCEPDIDLPTFKKMLLKAIDRILVFSS